MCSYIRSSVLKISIPRNLEAMETTISVLALVVALMVKLNINSFFYLTCYNFHYFYSIVMYTFWFSSLRENSFFSYIWEKISALLCPSYKKKILMLYCCQSVCRSVLQQFRFIFFAEVVHNEMKFLYRFIIQLWRSSLILGNDRTIFDIIGPLWIKKKRRSATMWKF